MNFDQTGIILYTIEYKKCVDFYRDLLGLYVLFEAEDLTCFEFGQSYLMVEVEDENVPQNSEPSRHKTCLRMNVPNVKALADKLKAQSIKVDYQEHS